MVKTS